ncbi:MAG: transglutaminase family protein [Verrucomicrobiaceae bacterium]|jgi:transglutaminase-like putative cysteine protease|nr:transglutaminase family protein [Verrucomicrobiaceae bacterium]
MRLRIFHRTRYLYRTAVSESHNEVRLHPATDDSARLEFFLLNVQPPVRLKHFRDEWMNYVHWFDISEPHTTLSIDAQLVVQTSSPYTQGKPLGTPFSALQDMQDELLAPFLQSSSYVDINRDVWKEALDVKAGVDDVFAVAEALMSHVNASWAYVPGATHASTHMREVMRDRQGVCQDFAHVLIGMCRSLGIPARYVSGYLYNGPGAHLRGAQATHAWCEVWVPGRGWFGLDPTNNTLADERHIKIATGRDYAEAAPITGQFDGPFNATMAMQIEVEVSPA